VIERMLDRLYQAVNDSDVGVPTSVLNNDMLRAVNMALSRAGGVKLKKLDDAAQVRRALMTLEREQE
tara:strand:+ start:211 stop:411 length:201 start_codon:yes stop_codon:yes gene_type:complete